MSEIQAHMINFKWKRARHEARVASRCKTNRCFALRPWRRWLLFLAFESRLLFLSVSPSYPHPITAVFSLDPQPPRGPLFETSLFDAKAPAPKRRKGGRLRHDGFKDMYKTNTYYGRIKKGAYELILGFSALQWHSVT